MAFQSHKDYWKNELHRNRKFYGGKIRPFDKWERNRGPHNTAENYLILGLELLYADADSPWSEKFLRASVELVDRAFSENKLEEGGHPINRGTALRARAYAQALLTGELLVDDLKQASRDYQQWCTTYSDSEWDSQSQAYYLNAVRLALLADDVEQAAALLTSKRSFGWHHEEYTLWQALVPRLSDGTPIQDPPLHKSMEAYFDLVRDPQYKPSFYLENSIVRFETGALYYKYFVSREGAIDWPAVIDSISR